MKALRTRYFGATNVRGARIIADDGDGNRITVPYHGNDSHRKAAIALCEKMGWWNPRLVFGYSHEGMVWVFDELSEPVEELLRALLAGKDKLSADLLEKVRAVDAALAAMNNVKG